MQNNIQRESTLRWIAGIIVLMLLSGCSTAKVQARKEERNRVAAATHLFCDFVSGETYPDAEVELSIEMGRHCEPDKPMTVTSYRSPSENIGLVYCCNYKEESSNRTSESRAKGK